MTKQEIIKSMIQSIEDGNRIEVDKLKNTLLPSSLYRYRPLNEYTISSLEKKAVWASNMLSLNDPYECFFALDYLKIVKSIITSEKFQRDLLSRTGFKLNKDELAQIADSLDPELEYDNIMQSKSVTRAGSSNKEMILKDHYSVIDNLRKMMYVSCFSERNDSLLMWSHYADSHKGICVEYNFVNSDVLHCLYPIHYDDDMVDMSFPKEKSKILLAAITKAKDWEYEQEWRIAYPIDEGEKINQLLLTPVPTKILLGCRYEENLNNNELIKRLINFSNQHTIPIVQTKRHATKFQIVLE